MGTWRKNERLWERRVKKVKEKEKRRRERASRYPRRWCVKCVDITRHLTLYERIKRNGRWTFVKSFVQCVRCGHVEPSTTGPWGTWVAGLHKRGFRFSYYTLRQAIMTGRIPKDQLPQVYPEEPVIKRRKCPKCGERVTPLYYQSRRWGHLKMVKAGDWCPRCQLLIRRQRLDEIIAAGLYTGQTSSK